MTLKLEDTPAAWLVPHLLDLAGLKVNFARVEGSNLSDAELKDMVSGTVAWSAEVGFLDDGAYSVTDKFGVVHHPVPLFRKANDTQAASVMQ